MTKEKISVTVDAAVLAAIDADARAAGLNRSEMIEQALRNEHLRVALRDYTAKTVTGVGHRCLRTAGVPGEPGGRKLIAPGDIAPRRDSEHELYVAVLSNALHRAADTGRVITCPFIPGRVPEDLLAMVVAVEQPNGTLLPELVQWLHVAALGAPLGNAGVAALREAASVVTALLC